MQGMKTRSGPAVVVSTPRTEGAIAPAERIKTPGWRDPRMWVGVALVALSVIAGARLLGGADDTVAVWALAVDKQAGEELTVDDLVAADVRFGDAEDLAGYLRASEQIAPGARMVRAATAGELLPRSSYGTSVQTGIIEVPLAVAGEQVPPAVGVGSVVDVWVVDPDADPGKGLRPIFEDVVVIAAPQLADGFVAGNSRQLVVGLPGERGDEVGPALAASAAGTLVVTRRG